MHRINHSKSTVGREVCAGRPRLWFGALVGAALGLGGQLLAGVARNSLPGTPFAAFIDQVFAYSDQPVYWALKFSSDAGILQKHDAIGVLIVFCLYYALLGSLVGLSIAFVLRARARRGHGTRES